MPGLPIDNDRIVPRTEMHRQSPVSARLALVGFALLTLFCIGVTLSPWKSGYADAPNRGASDIDLYRAVARRVQAGQGYYSALQVELLERGYPTRSIFNWRTPLPIWLIGKLPHLLLGKLMLCGLAIAGMSLGFALLLHEGSAAQACCGAALMFGGWLPCFLDENFVMPMLWASVCIGLSLAAYSRNRPNLGQAAGLAALFLRELAAPYCVLCLMLALRQRRYREAITWLIGFIAYGLFFAAHALAAARWIGPDSPSHDAGWVRFGGAAFVISTVQMNCYLLLLPQWVTAIYFALAVLGLAAWNSPAGERTGLTVALYVSFLAIVGQPFNQYWGLLIVAPCCLGVVHAPAAFRDLFLAGQWSAICWRSKATN